LAEQFQVVDGRQGVEPGTPRRRHRPQPGGRNHGVHHALDVLGRLRSGRRRGGHLPRPAGPELQLHDLDRRRGWLRVGAGPGVGGLELDEASRARSSGATTGDRRIEAGRHRVAQHIDGVVVVVHAQRHPQVGVGAQAVLDDPRRPLGGHDQVQPQGATPLGDVHHPVHELGHLARQGRELIDDDHQAGRAGRIARQLEVDEVLDPLLLQEQLPVMDLGTEAPQRPADQVRRKIGHHADGVRQGRAGLERRPALVVDEQEGHPVRAVGVG